MEKPKTRAYILNKINKTLERSTLKTSQRRYLRLWHVYMVITV